MNERKKTLQNCWAVRKRKAPLPSGAAGEKPGPWPVTASARAFLLPRHTEQGTHLGLRAKVGFPDKGTEKGVKKGKGEETGASAPGRVATDLHPGRHSGPLADAKQQVLVLGRELRQRLLPPLVDQGEGEVHALCRGQSLQGVEEGGAFPGEGDPQVLPDKTGVSASSGGCRPPEGSPGSGILPGEAAA